ncbi:udp-arabinose 4-epimerase 1 [Quercus suber]|uniref:Udp-arabinose 4-epimerase 1 n=1 Tax=Quercus suber TaxID=58331 RepID=A0AAW0JA38_QUESU
MQKLETWNMNKKSQKKFTDKEQSMHALPITPEKRESLLFCEVIGAIERGGDGTTGARGSDGDGDGDGARGTEQHRQRRSEMTERETESERVYFNVIGSDPEGRLGEAPRPELREYGRISGACGDAASGTMPGLKWGFYLFTAEVVAGSAAWLGRDSDSGSSSRSEPDAVKASAPVSAIKENLGSGSNLYQK